jgi:hypothetical protein
MADTPPPRPDPSTSRSGPPPPRLGALAVAAGVAVAAIAVVFSLTTTMSGRPTPTNSEGAPATTIPSTPGPSTSVPSTSAPGEATAIPDMVVAGPDGLTVVEGGEVAGTIDIGPIMLALDDGRGGVVFQVGMSASSIMRIPPSAGSSVEVRAPGGDRVLELHDIDGETGFVVYTSRPGTVEAGEEVLHLLDLESGEARTVGTVAGASEEVTRVSAAGDAFLLTLERAGATWLEMLADDGTTLDLSDMGPITDPSRPASTTWVGHGVLAPDGASAGYLRESTTTDGIDLVQVDVETGRESTVTPLEGIAPDSVVRLEWDAEVAVVSSVGEPPLVVRDGTTSPVDARGTATFSGP